MNTPVYMIFTILAGLLSCNASDETKPRSFEDKETITFTTLKLQDLNRKELDLNYYKGKTVFLNFWATWCKPCIEEMPFIENAKNMLTGQKVIFLLASDESIEQIMEFKTNLKSELDFVRIDNLEDLNIHALPTTFIYNAEGQRAFSETGYRKWDDSTSLELIRKILK